MDTSKLKKFAQFARRSLIEQVRVKLESVLAEASAGRREAPEAVQELQKEVGATRKEQVVERVAYTWFNRFCALRYMDVNRYTRIGIVSPEPGRFQPEILAEAKMGHIDEDMVPKETRHKVTELLDGSLPSNDPQTEAYRLLLVAACNHYHRVMPFMFERIADYTELLLPDDLLSGNSILAYTREALLPANCSPEYTDENVEVIGWLYQFYVSEKKDDVFAALKKGKKITPENIPAATQLFTPHWIVRYLVENSLGRLWMLNHPDSKLIERMDYYIDPVSDKALAVGSSTSNEPNPRLAPSGSEENGETDFLRISSPEEIKICDPACGSGHMLTYAFDLLYAIYEEQGYQATDIPRLILTHNLYGIEIDQRAGALAAFALTMKAREKYRRFLQSGKVVQPNICVLENIQIDSEDLSAYMDKVGRDLFSDGLQGVVNQWEEADNFGSLIRPLVTDVSEVLELLRALSMGEDLFLAGVHQKVLRALRQADYLSPKYHVVVANPPYMGANSMTITQKEFLNRNYSAAKSDLMTCFMERAQDLVEPAGFWGMLNIPSWMFLSSYEDLRMDLLRKQTMCTLLHLGRGIFGADFGTVAFTVQNQVPAGNEKGVYRRLFEEHVQVRKPDDIRRLFLASSYNRFTFPQSDFQRIPGGPIAYWIPLGAFEQLETARPLGELAKPRKGMCTRDNEFFVRGWHEVSLNRIGFDHASREEAKASGRRWFPYQKGGKFRKWYGNHHDVVDWENDGYRLLNMEDLGWKGNSTNHNLEFIFKPALVWSKITAAIPSYRSSPKGFLFDDASGLCHINDISDEANILGMLSSVVGRFYMQAINPTLNIQPGNMASMPICLSQHADSLVLQAIEISRRDWDSHEGSWAYEGHSLARTVGRLKSLADEYLWHQRAEVEELREIEEKINIAYITDYALSETLDAYVPMSQVSLLANAHYRYDDNKSESELEALLLADTMREFISYAVGCMLGRYSLDKPGLILANQGETADDYRQQIPQPTFAPDEDNVIPLLDGDWFTDDISERFKTFLKVTFGTEHYEENLTFLENGLYPENLQGKRRKTIRDYFLKEFYNHHVKMYKKRPIYWMFSSPKGTFNALIYMHRYRPDTVSVVLNDYLREFHTKLTAKVEHLQAVADSGSGSKSEKAKALKEITKLKKDLKELEDYEHNVLYPLATRQIEIDLDDGVKVNYNKFGKALKKVPGLSK